MVGIDLFAPTPEERAAVGAALGCALPERADMQEIELSARPYREGEQNATIKIFSVVAVVAAILPYLYFKPRGWL